MATTQDGTGNLGPGTLKIGQTASMIDVSCLVNNAKIEPNITAGETKTMLCGTQKSAPDEIEWALSGNVDVDAGLSDGLFALSWEHIGETVDFEFTPSTAVGTKVTGQLKIAPLALGADNQGDYINSDFEYTLIGFNPATAVVYGDAGAVELDEDLQDVSV